MSNKMVPKKQTPFNTEELIPSFISAWKKLFKEEPTKQQIAMIMSQNALETGGISRNAMFNYNIGNITKTPSDTFDYFLNQDSYKGKKFMSKFRSYNSIEEGIEDYLKLLKHGYPQAMAVSNKTPKDFAYALVANPKARYYDETHREDYANGMSSLYNQFLTSKKFDQSFKSAVQNVKQDGGILDNLFTKLETFLKSLFAQENKNKFLILVNSQDKTSSVEFARILCLAAHEEINGNTDIYLNNNNVEIECSFDGNKELAKQALSELSNVMSDVFFDATKKIGGIKVNTYIIENTKSKYKKAEDLDTYFRKFHLKFMDKK